MGSFFDPGKCDLCGQLQTREVVHTATGHSLRSDWVIVPSDLLKVACVRCGLIRSGGSLLNLEDDYRHNYETTKLGEHVFFTANEVLPRSRVIASWLVSAVGEPVWQSARKILEVGAGSGALLHELQHHFPGVVFEGLELNADSAQLGRERGLNVASHELKDHHENNYDIIYSVAVLEHVPSPSEFLSEIHKHLKPGGVLCLVQPTQDVTSYDIFFVDHLHHFGTAHLKHWAKKSSFRDLKSVVGHPLMPNFSLNVWKHSSSNPTHTEWQGPPVLTKAPTAAAEIMEDFQRLNSTLASLKARKAKVAVFGLAEVFWLASAYTDLGIYPIVCGLDDFPETRTKRFSFPLAKPEEAPDFGVTDVILAMNHIYYAQAQIRLEKLGIRAYPLFSSPVT